MLAIFWKIYISPYWYTFYFNLFLTEKCMPYLYTRPAKCSSNKEYFCGKKLHMLLLKNLCNNKTILSGNFECTKSDSLVKCWEGSFSKGDGNLGVVLDYFGAVRAFIENAKLHICTKCWFLRSFYKCKG